MEANRWILLWATLLVCAIAGGASGGICSGSLDRPDFLVHGFGLNPYRDGDGPGSNIAPQQVREMLETISPYTHWIRSYSSTHGLEEMATEGNDLGLKVAMGVWIRHEISREAEISNMVAKAQAGLVDMVVVGNEELYAYEEECDGAIDPCTLEVILADVHIRLDIAGLSDIPVVVSEPWYTLFRRDIDDSFKYQEVLDEVDVFLVNIYPFHRGVSIDAAIADLDAIYWGVVADANEAGPNKSVMISETGWPTEGETEGQARPSAKNAASYFYDVQCWAVRNDVNVFYFSAYDEQWKAEVPGAPEYSAHWGLWQSDEMIKTEFLPSAVFCEDFDPQINAFCAETRESDDANEPNVLGGDPNSDGDFLRLQYDGEMSHYSAATFDRVAVGPYKRLTVMFDFRASGVGTNADGFSCLLIPTSSNGTSGCATHGHSGFYAERPLLRDTLGIGFDIYQWQSGGPSGPCDQIYVSWDHSLYPDGNAIDVQPMGIDLDSGQWHQARVDVSYLDGDTAVVSIAITQDVYDPCHGEAVAVVEGLVIGDAGHPYRPYESRLEFAGRNGGLTANVDIDNIYMSYSMEFCGYLIEGDFDDNCRVDLFDLAVLAQNWLIDCRSTPGNPACVPK